MKKVTTLFIALLLFGISSTGTAQTQFIDRLFKQEHIIPGTFSPDGNWYAYVVSGAMDEGIDFGDNTWLWGAFGPDLELNNYNSVIYLLNLKTKRETALAQPSSRRASMWQPKWSPDGRFLAFIKLEEEKLAGHPQIWVLNLNTRQQTRVSNFLAAARGQLDSFFWSSANELVFSEIDKEPASLKNAYYSNSEMALKGWQNQQQGKYPSLDILESKTGGYGKTDFGYRSHVVKVNVLNQVRKDIVSYNEISTFQMGPGQRYGLAMTIDTLPPLPTTRLLNTIAENARVKLLPFTTDGRLINKDLDTLNNIIRSRPPRFSWSPDGTKLVFEAFVTVDDYNYAKGKPVLRGRGMHTTRSFDAYENDISVFTYDFSKNVLTRLNTTGIIPYYKRVAYSSPMYTFKWTGSGDLLIRAQASKGSNPPQWWQLSERAPVQVDNKNPELTATFCFIDRHHQLQLASGKLLALDLLHLTQTPLTKGLTDSITEVSPLPGTRNFFKVTALKKSKTGYYLLDLSRRLFIPVLTKGGVTDLQISSSGQVAYLTRDKSGNYLFQGTFTSQSLVRYKKDEFGNYPLPRIEKLTYQNPKGDTLTGWLLYPARYQKGTRYPLITWPYQGSLNPDTPYSFKAGIRRTDMSNLVPFADAGYAVLIPSMPGQSSDNSAMPGGIMPAVDQAIAMGLADSTRLAIAGSSGGGFTTYGMITQTSRFKTAIAMQGMTDYLTLYLAFDFRIKYKDPMIDWFRLSYYESGAHALGALPWRDPAAYMRESPLFNVEKIKTPVLIIQGDNDYVSMLNGEEMYTALFRLNKSARFIRYWGEDHVFSSPANIKSSWEQMFKWLEETGCPPNTKP